VTNGSGSQDPAEKLFLLLGGKWLAAAVSAAATLGLADALSGKSLTLETLAEEIECNAGSLERLMRVLVGEGIVTINDKHEYALTEMGELLRADELGELAKFVGSPVSWDPWSALPDAVRTGEAAFTKHHGKSLFDYLDQHDEESALYQSAIEAFSRREARALATAFDFSASRRIADVGGGRGTLLLEVLEKWPHLSGVLLERPSAAAQAQAAFTDAGLADRCEARVGDFFSEVPQDVDVCVLMHIIHSWDDATSIDLLRRCREAVGPDGTILIVEGLVVPDARRDLTNLLDLEMLVLCGPGHERRKPAMRRLLSAAGLRLERSVPLINNVRMMVAKSHPT
jgi:SAM-dependent methyltransferase